MAILVDALRPYPHAGLRYETWCHLVSDRDFDELHAFAARLGLRRAWFQGDHYDLPEPVRARAVALGAEEVAVGELLLRMAGPRGDRRRRRALLPRGEHALRGPAAPGLLRYATPGLVVVTAADAGAAAALVARVADPGAVVLAPDAPARAALLRAPEGVVVAAGPAAAARWAEAAGAAAVAAHLVAVGAGPPGRFTTRTLLDPAAAAGLARIAFGWVGRDRVRPPSPA
jgi:hypothetical protein